MSKSLEEIINEYFGVPKESTMHTTKPLTPFKDLAQAIRDAGWVHKDEQADIHDGIQERTIKKALEQEKRYEERLATQRGIIDNHIEQEKRHKDSLLSEEEIRSIIECTPPTEDGCAAAKALVSAQKEKYDR